MFTALLSAVVPLTAGANGKAKRAAVADGILVIPQKPAPRISNVDTGTKTSRTLVLAKARKAEKAKARKATVAHLLKLGDYRPDEHIRDDLSFFEVRRDGVIWDAATQGKPTPQRVRQAMRGKAIAADLIEEELSEHNDPSEVHRDRTYALDAVLAERQPVVVRRDIPDGGPSHDRVVVVRDNGSLFNHGYAVDGIDEVRVDGNPVRFIPYANEAVIGATPAFKPFDAKTQSYGKTTIRMRGGINALPPGAAYTITNRRTGAEVASGEAHEETGSFRADLELDDYQADDVYDLIVKTESGFMVVESSAASYEFRAPAAKVTAPQGRGAIALQGVRLRAKGTTVTRPQFARAEEETLTYFRHYLESTQYESGITARVRDGLAAYKAGKATPFERLQLLSAITARVKGLNLRGYGQGDVRLLDVVIDEDTVTFKLESTDARKQLTTQVYTLAE